MTFQIMLFLAVPISPDASTSCGLRLQLRHFRPIIFRTRHVRLTTNLSRGGYGSALMAPDPFFGPLRPGALHAVQRNVPVLIFREGS
jgi:hypothetical protein